MTTEFVPWWVDYEYELSGANLDLKLDELIQDWFRDYDKLLEPYDYHDYENTKQDFLNFCSKRFDSALQWGPACKYEPPSAPKR